MCISLILYRFAIFSDELHLQYFFQRESGCDKLIESLNVWKIFISSSESKTVPLSCAKLDFLKYFSNIAS